MSDMDWGIFWQFARTEERGEVVRWLWDHLNHADLPMVFDSEYQ
jgi:hypothetical protein